MKKYHLIYWGILCIGLLLVNSIFCFPLVAEENYPQACGNFEVSYIQDDGSFRQEACFADFASAKQRMKELGGDYVVRSANSYSPTKIVAMNSGLAYAYPGRGKKATLNIYEDLYERSIYKKTTYVSHHYELYYHDTVLVTKSGREGMVKVTLNGFEGYTDLEYVDLVPSKYLDKGIPLWIGGQNTYFNESPFRIIVQRNTFQAVRHGSYVDLQYTFHLAYPVNGSLYNEEYSINVGPAPSFMQEGKNYYSRDGIHFYQDSDLTLAAGTEYSYYQWLPLRSQTKITAPELESFLRQSRSNYVESKLYQKASAFVSSQSKYGMNGLLVYAMAAHESNFGLSNFARQRNNLFGWKAYDAAPGKAQYFSSIEKSVEEHMGINLRGYVDVTDGRFFGPSLGNKAAGLNVKYASDPYWGMKIAAIAYAADKAANNYNGQLRDYHQYDLAVIQQFDAEVKSQANANSRTLYTTAYGPSYQKDFMVICLGEEGDYIKIQSTNALQENGDIMTHLTPPTVGEVNPISEYDFQQSVAYVKKSDLLRLHYSTKETKTVPGEYLHQLTELGWEENKLHIKGQAYFKNLVIDRENIVEHRLLLEGEDDNQEYVFTTTRQEDSSFDEYIDVSQLNVGTYSLKIATRYSGNDQWQDSFALPADKIPSTRRMNAKIYTFRSEQGALYLTVSQDKKDHQPTLVSAKNIHFNEEDGLKFSGVGIFKGIDAIEQNDMHYRLVLYPLNEHLQRQEFLIDTIDSQGFSLNDGHNYHYGSYDVSLTLADIPDGKYGLALYMNEGSLEEEVPICNARSEVRHVAFQVGDTTYRLAANEVLNYRLELEKISTPLDFTAIKKPSSRASLISYNNIHLDENALSIKAHALIYYLDYPDLDSAEYEVWAVKDSQHAIKLNTENQACEVNYTKILRTKNNSDAICFTALTNLKNREAGDYYLYVGIRRGEYYDIVPMYNRSFRATPRTDNYEVLTDKYSQHIFVRIK